MTEAAITTEADAPSRFMGDVRTVPDDATGGLMELASVVPNTLN